ncbi:MAG TPA: methionine ABC transporter ATP-binding protein [Beutenbergiaceae bacterium]|nr:methionine ABC transporter ATP-binding protein [Beutenbergiaceae bacterium]
MGIIDFTRVTKDFSNVRAVDDVSLSIREGEIFGVIGYSGAGKSTLVRLINALEPITSGSLQVAGTEIAGLPEAKLRPLRSKIGMIFQHFNLMNSRTVAQNIAYPLKVAGWAREERNARVAELLDFVGLADKAKTYPSKLSGGQKQRVGIARALASKPGILLADEPTSALDPETTTGVLDLLRRVNSELGVTVVVITHEMNVVRAICNRVAVMEAGKVVELGSTYEVFTRPKTAVTAAFVTSVLQDRPTPDVLARLRGRHSGRLVTIGVDDDAATSAEVMGVFSRQRIGASVVYGSITEVAGRPSGSLTYELSGENIDAALANLRGRAEMIDWGSATQEVDR